MVLSQVQQVIDIGDGIILFTTSEITNLTNNDTISGEAGTIILDVVLFFLVLQK